MSNCPGGAGVPEPPDAMPTPSEIKQALLNAGFEIYQTRGDVVHLAERVRENLLMDSGIRVHTAQLGIVFTVRAQQSDFPGDTRDLLFERARRLGEIATARGFCETETRVTPILDPGDGTRTLDTCYEVSFRKDVSDVTAALEELRFALLLEKQASRRP